MFDVDTDKKANVFPFVSTSQHKDPYHRYVTLLPMNFEVRMVKTASYSPYLDEVDDHNVRDHSMLASQLLAIADYVEANRARLEAEAAEDNERNQKAMDADAADVQQIANEWHHYRLQGDELPPSALR